MNEKIIFNIDGATYDGTAIAVVSDMDSGNDYFVVRFKAAYIYVKIEDAVYNGNED